MTLLFDVVADNFDIKVIWTITNVTASFSCALVSGRLCKHGFAWAPLSGGKTSRPILAAFL